MYRNDELDLLDPLKNNQQRSIQSFDTHQPVIYQPPPTYTMSDQIIT